MNFKTKRKNLEENLFADMVVLAGAYMKYINTHPTFTRDDIVQYFDSKKNNIKERCAIQNYVIRQAKRFYEENGQNKNITYSRVKRIFRKNTLCSYRIRIEQYFFWQFVMDYIVGNDELLDIMFKEVLKECKFYSPTENGRIPYTNCLQRILDWYYVRIRMNNKIFRIGKDKREKMLSMFNSYEQFPQFKIKCRSYIGNK